MSDTNTEKTGDQLTVEQWLQIRKEAGLKIDPETAEVMWDYVQILDPYDVYPDLSEEEQQTGRGYFARAPGSDIWVSFRDLPDETEETLWEMHKSKLAFPAGLDLSVADFLALLKEDSAELQQATTGLLLSNLRVTQFVEQVAAEAPDEPATGDEG